MSDNQIETLNHLISVCEDAREFYEDAAEKVENPHIESTFKTMAGVRANIINELKSRVTQCGGKPEDDGTFKGGAAQFFTELKAKVSNTDETFVAELEEAEDRGLEEFHAAMAKNLPEETRAFLQEKTATLRKTHDHMKELKDHMQAA